MGSQRVIEISIALTEGTAVATALTEGTSIDFLFGSRDANFSTPARRKSASLVKKFVRDLNSTKQFAVVKFYGQAYRAISCFHDQVSVSSCCYYCVRGNYQIAMISQLNEAFNALHVVLYNNDI